MFKNSIAWLIGADRTVPDRTDTEVLAEMEVNYRWNYAVNLLDGASFWFGASFISATTILPLFVSKLSDTALALGVTAVIAQSGWFLPQLFMANTVEGLPSRKPIVVNLGFLLERLPLWILVLAAALAARQPELALVLFLISIAWHTMGAGVIAPAWQDLLARCFPVERRGRFFGVTNFIGTGTGALGAALSAWLLVNFPFPTNFVYTFLIAAVGVNLSWVFIALTREPSQPNQTPSRSNRQFWSDIPAILRRDHNFRRYLVARSLIALGGLSTGFVTISAVVRWDVPDSTVGVYTGVMLVGQTIGNLTMGWLADRFGHKLSLELGALASGLAFIMAWLAPSPVWYFGVFFLMGVTLGAVIVSGILVIMEFSEPERRPTYAGIANTGVGLVAIVAPLIGAWIAEVDYDLLFGLSAGIYILGLVMMRWGVQEPRWVEKTVTVSKDVR